MKALLLTLLLWQATGDATPPADPHFFRYQRAITPAPQAPPPVQGILPLVSHPTALPPAAPANTGPAATCATLDGQVYAAAALALKDLRLYQGTPQPGHELPYAITLSQLSDTDSEPAKVFNLGKRDQKIVFDLAMPDRAYTDVVLDLETHDFIANAEVSGLAHPGAPPTRLGAFTLFDLTAQHLSRNTTLHLQESRFPTLHVELTLNPAPNAPPPPSPVPPLAAIVLDAAVLPSRVEQTVFTTVAQTSDPAATLTQIGHRTIATMHLRARVPVERVAIELPASFKGNFSRTVQVAAQIESQVASPVADAPNGTPIPGLIEGLVGTIDRTHVTEEGHNLNEQQFTIPAVIGANLKADAVVEVLIDNGDDKPLPITAVLLQMRQRRICFNAPTPRPSPIPAYAPPTTATTPGTPPSSIPTVPAIPLTLFYGDPALEAPVYDFARTLSLTGNLATALLGPEQPNPTYTPRPTPPRPLTERHPEFLWIVLLAVVCLLAVVALHQAKRLPK